MASRSALRPRQTSTAATIAQTPLKDTKRVQSHSSSRKSLPRTAKMLAELDGYEEQLLSPPKRPATRHQAEAETPATKISNRIKTKLVIESPKHGDDNLSLGSKTPRSAARRLDLNKKPSRKKDEVALEPMEVEHDENVPPPGDTVGRRFPKRTAKAVMSAPSHPSSRTPLRMKIKKINDTAKVCDYTIERRPATTRRVAASPDANLVPLKTRLRTVVLNEKGSVQYRTVGPESPWGVKRPPARIIPVKSKLAENSRAPKRDPSYEKIGQLEESCSSEDYSSSSSDEENDASDTGSDEEKTRRPWTVKRRKSTARPTIRFVTANVRSPEKKTHSVVRNPRMAVRKVETLEDFRRRLHTAEVPERMPCREEEAAEVERFIRNAIATRGLSSAMYISGVPGTGKTATVVSVVKQLSQDNSCNKFSFICVNAMEFVEPKKIFLEIYNQITGNTKKMSAMAARRKLNTVTDKSLFSCLINRRYC
ncbi:hypothetical protein Q1695_015263 [Nippostrongylus brasiliensis]|nr:hypothetical protein Q1695_015263 [Nippostrongylus brasiliensis]